MIQRHFNADLHNRIANDPAIRREFDWFGKGVLDFTEAAQRPQDYILLSDGQWCAVMLEWSAPGTWMAHTMIHPYGRGRQALRSVRAMVDWMFTDSDRRFVDGCEMLWGQTPPTILPHACWFNRQVGFQSAGIGFHHNMGEVERFVLRKTEWQRRQSQASKLSEASPEA